MGLLRTICELHQHREGGNNSLLPQRVQTMVFSLPLGPLGILFPRNPNAYDDVANFRQRTSRMALAFRLDVLVELLHITKAE